ncbi:MAG: sigma-54 dependent transcriptional regulator [Desulfocapsaceae bacterium]|nr:sigma-54 dependent transcriptional regulator [Desulfocapsaceae bacterium]
MATVLIVDDAEDISFSLGNLVKKEGFTPVIAATGNEALAILKTNIIDLIFLDIGLPDINGIKLIPAIREIAADSDIVMLTGRNEAKSAVDSLKAGAVDYIVKPFELIEFTTSLNRLMQSRLASKMAAIQSQKDDDSTMIGESQAMQPVKEALATAAEVKSPVLITGETGTGKELAAKAVHQQQTNKGVFVKVDCGTLSANLIESELFGYEKGAFTDAQASKKGLVEIADGGTLFLDEIGNLPISLQPKLLRLIADSTFRRVGGTRDIKVSVRIIAATNNNIEQQVANGHFRQDLFYRLNVIPIHLPPLRQRQDDIVLLAEYYLHYFNRELKKNIKGFTDIARANLLSHDWPGNIRELRNLVEREVIFCKSEWLQFQGDSPLTGKGEDNVQMASLAELERKHIANVLKACNNNKSKAAEILGITRTTLRTKTETG